MSTSVVLFHTSGSTNIKAGEFDRSSAYYIMKQETTFLELIATHCGQIVEKVLEGMRANRYKVGSGKIPIPTTPVLYSWWFPESFMNDVLVPYAKKYPSLQTLLREVDTMKIDEKTYYALYFGKSVNGYHRFCQHATGNIHISTLRRTLYGLVYDHIYNKEKEKNITAMLRECYYEWYEFKSEGELIECIEAICIALGKYPLNIEGNPAISEDWCKFLMNERTIK